MFMKCMIKQNSQKVIFQKDHPSGTARAMEVDFQAKECVFVFCATETEKETPTLGCAKNGKKWCSVVADTHL